MSSPAADRRHFLMTGDGFVDWRGTEFAVIERPQWSLRGMFRRSDQEVRVLSPDGSLLFQMPRQRTRDIDALLIEGGSGAPVATLRRTGREALAGNLFEAADAQGASFGTVRGNDLYTEFEVMDPRQMSVGHISARGGLTTIRCPDDGERWRYLLMGLAMAAEVAAELQAQRTP
ncbi:hypothetical protein HUT06_38330 [Actinomadura sp. NAK00032]|uniref:hypothetical protein n=1 Tax=Actinomadura sp. NAK00032 TaxID=2742128 RepID=UPI001590CA60|nr:hypothetical protein [Actinomadura sp. NAK00032]QKW39166.1 hypothetical protein HUT06_38330 [Actinomadura sp. NAK00032]